MSTGLSGMTFAATHVSQDRFIQNVGILQQMILDNWKDETYLTDLEELDLIVKNIRADRSKSVSDVGVARLKFKAITELLHRRGFFPETEQVSLLK